MVENLLFAQDAKLSGQLAQQREIRMMAQRPALREAANGKLRRLSAYNKSSNGTDVKIGGSAFFIRRPQERARLGGVARREFWTLMGR